MGEVYLARDVEIGRDVALKVLPSTFSSDKDRLQRFQQEACAAGALNHPNILSIYDVGKHDGSPHIVSEASFSVSDNGILAFQSGIMRGNGQLIWFDRNGKQISDIGELGFYGQPRLSNDNQKIAIYIFEPQLASSDIWIYELARNVPTRFTFDPNFDGDPLWSADGKQIVFGSSRKGFRNIYQKASDGSGSEEILFESAENKVPTSLSPDGRFLAFTNTDTKANTKQDIDFAAVWRAQGLCISTNTVRRIRRPIFS